MSGTADPPLGHAPPAASALDFETVDDATLLANFLPPRPDAPCSFRVWHRLFEGAPALQFVNPQLMPVPGPPSPGVSSGPPPPPPGQPGRPRAVLRGASFATEDDEPDEPGPPGPRQGHLGSSSNWSGAALRPNGGERFRQVSAQWTTPSVMPGQRNGPWVCSTWIGLGGLMGWMSSMPQMGTTQVSRQQPEPLPCYAWVQWWLSDREVQAPQRIAGIPLDFGNGVMCYVALHQPGPDPDSQRAIFTLRKAGTPLITSFALQAPLHNRKRWPTGGESAEWILERPKALFDDGDVKEKKLYWLPSFGSFVFEDVSSEAAPPGGQGCTQRLLVSPRLIRMKRRRPRQNRTEYLTTVRAETATRLVIKNIG
ncbi:MAG TPA: G1 family glutamic endopeptidase [Crenalkalicoccus sp.]|nr:G1 family glutamic endopeptidase [Crenalkalicoccus sp.]